MIRKLAAVAVTATLLIGGSAASASAPEPPARAKWMSRPCVYEDGINCFWNADSMGNGMGHSFYVRKIPGRRLTCAFYVERHYAKTHDYCVKSR